MISGPGPGEFSGFWGSMFFRHVPSIGRGWVTTTATVSFSLKRKRSTWQYGQDWWVLLETKKRVKERLKNQVKRCLAAVEAAEEAKVVVILQVSSTIDCKDSAGPSSFLHFHKMGPKRDHISWS